MGRFKIFCFLIIQLVLSNFSFSQKSIWLFNDSTKVFKEDIKVGVIKKENGNYLVVLKDNDSTILYKEYLAEKNILINAFYTDLEGNSHGPYFFYNHLNGDITNSIFFRGRIHYSVTVNSANDTIELERKFNESLYYRMEIRDSVKKEYLVTENMIYNGFYNVYNLNTNKIIIRGNYKAISEDQILNKENYSAICEKHNIAPYHFRGELSERELPIGLWYYYDRNGELIKKIKYDWEQSVDFK